MGTNPPGALYYTIENVRDAAGGIDQTAVRIHSINGTFPDTTAKVHEVGAGTPGKIAWRATLFGGTQFNGIMRANSAGGPACCHIGDRHSFHPLSECPVLSWWSAVGNTSCWQPVNVPTEVTTACGE